MTNKLIGGAGILVLSAIAGCDKGEDSGGNVDEGTMSHSDFDLQCAAVDSEEDCTPDAAGVSDSFVCDWVRRYVFASSSCEHPEIVEECRGVRHEGAGCLAASNLDGCSDADVAQAAFPQGNMPFFKQSGAQVEVLSGGACGAPPDFVMCEPATSPDACACPCTQ